MMNSQKPFFSIVVPVYCGAQYAEGLIEIMKNQGLEPNDFELIFVNDASPDNTASEIFSIIAKSDISSSLKLINNLHNLRQGGARNVGIDNAIGQYIIFIDQDDKMFEQALSKIKSAIQKHSFPDILMFDHSIVTNENDETIGHYYNSLNNMTGREFLISQEIPWCPWLYAYKNDLLKRDTYHKLRFESNVRFEDADFVMRCTLEAKTMAFESIPVIRHFVWDGQTSHVGTDMNRVHDLFKMCQRVKDVGVKELQVDKEAAHKIIYGHHHFMQKSWIKRYLWRLPYKDKVEILKTYRAYLPTNDTFLKISASYPSIFALVLHFVKPAIYCLWKFKTSLPGKS